MNNDLNSGGLIPTTELYTALGYTGLQNPGVSVTPGAFSQPVVDWVIVELRDSANPATVLTAQAALLLNNGCVVSHDGGSLVNCCILPGNYYVAIRHRNHLGVMTGTPIPLN